MLPLFVSPILIIIALILFGLIYKKSFFIYISVIGLFLFSLPIVSNFIVWSIESGQTRISVSEIENADAIVVLGGMTTLVKSSGGIVAEWIDPDRFYAGVDLALAKKAPYLIFIGGKLPWELAGVEEGVFLRSHATSLGVNQSSILVTPPALNTKEEAMATMTILSQKFHKKPLNIILVTSAFHMKRASFLFSEVGFKVLPYPVDFKSNVSAITPMTFIPNAHSLRDVEFSLREIIGRLYYLPLCSGVLHILCF